MRKQHFVRPLRPVLSIVPRSESTLEVKLSLINTSMICLDGTSLKNVVARGAAYSCRKEERKPRFCVDYRHTLNRHIVRKSWPFPNLDSCLDAAGVVKFISTADVLSAFWQLPVAEEHIDRATFVTPTGKFCFKRMPVGACNVPWLFQPMMSVTFGHLGSESGILAYMDDIIYLNSTFEAHLKPLNKCSQRYRHQA